MRQHSCLATERQVFPTTRDLVRDHTLTTNRSFENELSVADGKIWEMGFNSELYRKEVLAENHLLQNTAEDSGRRTKRVALD